MTGGGAAQRPSLLLRAFHRTLAFTHRQVRRFDRLLGEIPVVLHTPALERAALDAHYARASSYMDVRNQRAGLYPFEERMVERFFPPPPAHLLVHGAGAGREVLALLRKGYTVDAFEPVPTMVEAARREVGANTGARFERMTVQSWAEHPSGTFDGVVCGWGMWMHVLDQRSRLAVLHAFRQVCPNGAVLLSFWRSERLFVETVPSAVPLHPPPATRVERFTRATLRQRWLRLPPVERGIGWYAGLYVHCVTEDELREEAALAGYDVAYYEREAEVYPHAVLLPRKG